MRNFWGNNLRRRNIFRSGVVVPHVHLLHRVRTGERGEGKSTADEIDNAINHASSVGVPSKGNGTYLRWMMYPFQAARPFERSSLNVVFVPLDLVQTSVMPSRCRVASNLCCAWPFSIDHRFPKYILLSERIKVFADQAQRGKVLNIKMTHYQQLQFGHEGQEVEEVELPLFCFHGSSASGSRKARANSTSRRIRRTWLVLRYVSLLELVCMSFGAFQHLVFV